MDYDEVPVEFRGVMRRVPPPRGHPKEDVPFGTGEGPQVVPDGSAVSWPGLGRFYFNDPVQRGIVRELWQAWQRGRPWVNQSALLRMVGSGATRLSELFRQGNGYLPLWGTLIVRAPVAGAYGFPRS